MELERKVLELIAMDRIEMPISSLSGKLKRQKPKFAKEIDLNGKAVYDGERCYARIKKEDLEKARGIREGVEEFSKKFPNYGKILNGLIEEKRKEKETHLYFGMNPGSRITADDYREVMTNLGFTPAMAEDLYPALMDVSRKLSKKRDEERSIMIG